MNLHKEQTKLKKEMKRLLFLVNPGAGTGDPRELEEVIKKQFGETGTEFRIHYLDEDDPLAQAGKLIQQIEPDTVVAAGGDGTINMVATAILGKGINLGILPAGSSNGLAYELGIPTDFEEAVSTVAAGNLKALDALMINDRHLCLHLSDLGLNARVVRRYDHEGIRGFYGYARQYFRELTNRKKFRCEVKTGKEVHRRKCVMVIMANGSFYGTGASVTPDGKPDDGLFKVILIDAYPFWFLFYMLISIFTRRFNDSRFRKIIQCREAMIQVEPSQELQSDGEHIGRESEVSVRLLEACINLISGK